MVPNFYGEFTDFRKKKAEKRVQFQKKKLNSDAQSSNDVQLCLITLFDVFVIYTLSVRLPWILKTPRRAFVT